MPLDKNVRSILQFLGPRLKEKHGRVSRSIILGVTGLQGSGKSTWASKLVDILSSSYGLRTITVSLDDFYKTHDDLIAQRDKNPGNRLYRTRGQPGTHDEKLAAQFFANLNSFDGEGELKIPRFDKSQFNGEGDRAPETEWPTVTGKVDVVVFEGWCVGFKPLPDSVVESKHKAARSSSTSEEPESINTLADHELPHLLELNANLKRYNEAFMGPQHFDFMIHIDTDDLRNVYRWRLQQEHALIKAKGSGMSDESVIAFVRGYMPGYELYLENLREGFFEDGGRQFRIVLDQERLAKNISVI